LIDKTLHTRADLWEMIRRAESLGEPTLFELIHGEAKLKMVTMRHGIVAGNIYGHLWMFVRKHKLGHVMQEVHFGTAGDPYNDRVPDVSFVSVARNLPVIDKGTAPFMPDLAVEVKSDGNTYKELRGKAEYYLQNGAQLVWLMYPEKHQVEVCTLNDDHNLRIEVYSEGSIAGRTLLPDFSVSLDEIFEA
jgi:Uma2 family endonuclease